MGFIHNAIVNIQGISKIDRQNIIDYCKDIGIYISPVLKLDSYTPKYLSNIKNELRGFPSKLKILIDCGDNISLFKAIISIRGDSDKYQFFITDANQQWINQETYSPKGSIEYCMVDDRYMGRDPVFSSFPVPAHKASVEELIERQNELHEFYEKKYKN